jgi:methenyltetrahydrofolate cyclohydrolase
MTSSDAELSLVTLRVDDFLARLANAQPTPGGGSAAAVAGAMAGALTCMVTRLTIGRERYAANQQQMHDVRKRAETLLQRLTALVDKDAVAYDGVIEAYVWPKDSEAERIRRAAGIQDALRHASEVPLEAAEACAELIELAATCTSFGNRNAASDAAVAALLAYAGLLGALLNVHANLKQVQDQDFVDATEARLGQLRKVGEFELERALTSADLGDSILVHR